MNKQLLERFYNELPQQLTKSMLLDRYNHHYCAVGFGLHLCGVPDSLLVGHCSYVDDGNYSDPWEMLAEFLDVSVAEINAILDANDLSNDDTRYDNVRAALKQLLEQG